MPVKLIALVVALLAFPAGAYAADNDGDGFDDETADKCPSDRGSADGCPAADVSIEQSAEPRSIKVGEAVTFTMVVRNNGPDRVLVFVDQNVDYGATWESVTSDGPPGACFNRGPTGCGFEMEPGQTITVRAVWRATDARTTESTATATVARRPDAERAGIPGDPNPANNRAVAAVEVLPDPRTIAPRIEGLTLSSRGMRIGRDRRYPRVMTMRATLSERATVIVRIDRFKRTRYVRAAGMTWNARAGRIVRRFTAKIGRRKLAPGAYRLVLYAKDGDGNASTRAEGYFHVAR